MKRLIVLIIAATLCGLAASAQEVSSAANGVEISAVARFDANPYFPFSKGGETDFSFGNTSVYTFIDGTFGRGWSYSISNHWLGVDWCKSAPDDKMAPLYSNTWHSDSTNWVDWATLGYTLETESAGSWTFSLGKDMMAIGLCELEPNDVDMHFDLASFFWNGAPLELEDGTWFGTGMQVYQWGGSVDWTSPSEEINLRLQMSSSPYSVRPYQDSKMAFGLMYSQAKEIWTGRASVNVVGGYEDWDEEGNPFGTSWWRFYTIGESFEYEGFSGNFDAMMRGTTWANPVQEALVTAKLQYDFSDRASLFVKGGWEMFGNFPKTETKPLHTGFGGIGAYWYPLKNSQALRLHGIVATNTVNRQLSLNIGITYNWAISDFWNK